MRASWPHYVTAIMRTNAGINKAEDAGRMDAQIGFVDVLWWIFPTALTNSPISRVGPLGDFVRPNVGNI